MSATDDPGRDHDTDDPGPDEPEVIDSGVEEKLFGTTTSEDERRLRVYDYKGDFVITVPAKAKVTFGYFNPAGPQFERNNSYDRSSNVAVQTALRIYEAGEKSNQLACFIGVKGFRDERIKLTRMSQRVVIETNYENDGEGLINWGGKQQKQLVASPEPDTYS